MVRAKRVRGRVFKVINFSKKRTPEASAKPILKRCATRLIDGAIYRRIRVSRRVGVDIRRGGVGRYQKHRPNTATEGRIILKIII